MKENENHILKEKIKQLEEENKRLQKLAYYDSLTKTYNRTWFNMNITPKSKPFFVITDLNNLKTINDSKGHQEGDKYILDTVESLKHFGKIIRYGGDEFIVLCENKDLYHELLALETPNFSKGGAMPEEYNTIAEAIAIADKRLYEDKKNNNILN